MSLRLTARLVCDHCGADMHAQAEVYIARDQSIQLRAVLPAGWRANHERHHYCPKDECRSVGIRNHVNGGGVTRVGGV